MTAYSKVGDFLIDSTKTVGQTQSITGLGFQPKVLIFFLTSITALGNESALDLNMLKGLGMAVSSTERFAMVSFEADNVATTSAVRVQTNQGCLVSMDATQVTGLMDLSSMDSDGFTLSVSTQFPANYRVLYFAYGGTDITNVKIGTFQRPNTTGNQSISTVGFEPDVCFFMSSKQGTINGTVSVDGSTMFGVAGSNGQWVHGGGSNNGAAISQTINYACYSECIAFFDSAFTDVIGRASLSSFDSSGFTLNWLEDSDTTQHYIAYLAIAGGGWHVGNASLVDDGGGAPSGGITAPFGVLSVLLANVGDVDDLQNTVRDHDAWAIGGATDSSTQSRFSLKFYNADAADTSAVTLGAMGDTLLGGAAAALAAPDITIESGLEISGSGVSISYPSGVSNFHIPYVVFGATPITAIIPGAINSQQSFGIFETSPFTENFPGTNGSSWNPNNWVISKV